MIQGWNLDQHFRKDLGSGALLVSKWTFQIGKRANLITMKVSNTVCFLEQKTTISNGAMTNVSKTAKGHFAKSWKLMSKENKINVPFPSFKLKNRNRINQSTSMIIQRKSKLLHDSELLTYSILAYLEDIHQLGGPNFTLFLTPSPKLYIQSTLNIGLIQWHTHLNVCAVK